MRFRFKGLKEYVKKDLYLKQVRCYYNEIKGKFFR